MKLAHIKKIWELQRAKLAHLDQALPMTQVQALISVCVCLDIMLILSTVIWLDVNSALTPALKQRLQTLIAILDQQTHSLHRNQIPLQIVHVMLVIQVLMGRHALHAKKAHLNLLQAHKHVTHVMPMLTLPRAVFCKLRVNAMPVTRVQMETFV